MSLVFVVRRTRDLAKNAVQIGTQATIFSDHKTHIVLLDLLELIGRVDTTLI